ncbi:sulfotransferase family protein [Brevundimonas vesicularis]|uniref:sulfotransferase family protein n=1 Tax=Brevundimonas vesicularis TaxID=41276 RepID=UPI0038D3C08C
MRPAEDNPKGFWESEVLTALNDRLLAQGSSSWHDWRAFDWPAQGDAAALLVAEARIRVREEFGDAELIVLKDPRICRFLPFWRDVLEGMGYRVVCLSPLRAPAEVAASLMSRNKMSRSHALRLWLRHVLDAEYTSRDLPRLILPWTEYLADCRGQAPRIASALGINLDLDEASLIRLDDFLSPDLRRQTTVEAVPAMVGETFEILSRIGRTVDETAGQESLDRIRHSFNTVGALFSDAPI